MARRSKVTQLPEAVKAWLDNALIEGNFSGYEALSAELKKRGHDISKTGLHRYGQSFEERLCQLKASSEQAQAVVQAMPDEEDAMAQALVRLTQHKLFELVKDLNVNPEEVDISKITRSIAELARASITVKDYAARVRAKAQAAADYVATTVKAAGLSDEAAAAIRQKILGVAG